jgi:acetylornithine deacetylase
LLDVLEGIRSIPLPQDSVLGPATLNIGVIAGGRAPNVVADQAQAEIMFRIVGDPAALREAVAATAASRVEAREVLFTPAVRLTPFDGLPTTVVAFTTDIPFFQGAWGKPFLIGPGRIHVAHSSEECVSKKQLVEAVEIYVRMVKRLLEQGAESR